MNLSAKHPEYRHYERDWCVIRDTYAGETTIKFRGQEYLPATSGMVADGMKTFADPGWQQYEAYKRRAVFPDLVKQAVEAMVGLMHRKPPQITLPAGMEEMATNATLNGESLEVLLRRINEEQLLTGRLGLMVDVPDNGGPNALPYLITYYAESITNWDAEKDPMGRDRLAMVVLNESGFTRDANLDWKTNIQYRLMCSGSIGVELGMGALYATGITNDQAQTIEPSQLHTPSLAGRTLDQVPFVIIGSKDLLHKPDVPPLLSVARLSLTCYRGEADYRQTLFLQGQETMAIIGASGDGGERRIGAGSVIELPIGGDAKYIGVSANGLSEQRQALENDYTRAATSGAQLLESRGKSAESGDALRMRVAARTATLANIALTGAEGLQEALKLAARWRGLDETQVSVKPNMDFTEESSNIQDLVYLMDARERGIPLSLESIHRWLVRKGLTELEFDEEISQLLGEKATAKTILGPPPVAQAGGGPGGGTPSGSTA